MSKKNSKSVQLLQAVGGGLSGGITRFITQPFDVLKIRFQLQVEPLRASHISKYSGMIHAFSSIYREEGIRGLWRGHVAAQAMSITYALVQFWSYEQLRRAANDSDFFTDRHHLNYFVCGGMAGCLGTIAAQPFDVIRTRVVAADPGSRTGALRPLSGIIKIFSNEGFRGVTSGMMLTLLQIYPLVGANFVIYKFLNEMVVRAGEFISEEQNPNNKIHGIFLFFNGGFSGVLAKMLVYPLDLIKKRSMLSHFKDDRKSFGSNPSCGTIKQCIQNTFKHEGIAGFYKGMLPTLYKSGMMTAFYFTIYDSFNRNITLPYQRKEEEREGKVQRSKKPRRKSLVSRNKTDD